MKNICEFETCSCARALRTLTHALSHVLAHSLSLSLSHGQSLDQSTTQSRARHTHTHTHTHTSSLARSLVHMCMQWPFDRVGMKDQCPSSPIRTPLPKSQAQCQIGNSSVEANTIRRATPKSPPNRTECFKRSGYTLCYQDDKDPKQRTRIYYGICEDDPECKKVLTSEPWLGYMSLKPHGAALARTSNRFEIYDKQDATCISASEGETSDDGAE